MQNLSKMTDTTDIGMIVDPTAGPAEGERPAEAGAQVDAGADGAEGESSALLDMCRGMRKRQKVNFTADDLEKRIANAAAMNTPQETVAKIMEQPGKLQSFKREQGFTKALSNLAESGLGLQSLAKAAKFNSKHAVTLATEEGSLTSQADVKTNGNFGCMINETSYFVTVNRPQNFLLNRVVCLSSTGSPPVYTVVNPEECLKGILPPATGGGAAPRVSTVRLFLKEVQFSMKQLQKKMTLDVKIKGGGTLPNPNDDLKDGFDAFGLHGAHVMALVDPKGYVAPDSALPPSGAVDWAADMIPKNLLMVGNTMKKATNSLGFSKIFLVPQDKMKNSTEFNLYVSELLEKNETLEENIKNIFSPIMTTLSPSATKAFDTLLRMRDALLSSKTCTMYFLYFVESLGSVKRISEGPPQDDLYRSLKVVNNNTDDLQAVEMSDLTLLSAKKKSGSAIPPKTLYTTTNAFSEVTFMDITDFITKVKETGVYMQLDRSYVALKGSASQHSLLQGFKGQSQPFQNAWDLYRFMTSGLMHESTNVVRDDVAQQTVELVGKDCVISDTVAKATMALEVHRVKTREVTFTVPLVCPFNFGMPEDILISKEWFKGYFELQAGENFKINFVCNFFQNFNQTYGGWENINALNIHSFVLLLTQMMCFTSPNECSTETVLERIMLGTEMDLGFILNRFQFEKSTMVSEKQYSSSHIFLTVVCVIMRTVDYLHFQSKNIPTFWMKCMDLKRNVPWNLLAVNVLRQDAFPPSQKTMKYPKRAGFTPMHAVRIMAELRLKELDPSRTMDDVRQLVDASSKEQCVQFAKDFIGNCVDAAANDENYKTAEGYRINGEDEFCAFHHSADGWDDSMDSYTAGDDADFSGDVPADYGMLGKFHNDADGTLPQPAPFADGGWFEYAPPERIEVLEG